MSVALLLAMAGNETTTLYMATDEWVETLRDRLKKRGTQAAVARALSMRGYGSKEAIEAAISRLASGEHTTSGLIAAVSDELGIARPTEKLRDARLQRIVDFGHVMTDDEVELVTELMEKIVRGRQSAARETNVREGASHTRNNAKRGGRD